jgi:catechol 2,3-dioxygenase-like lactoylglutathione lyase family enzyme
MTTLFQNAKNSILSQTKLNMKYSIYVLLLLSSLASFGQKEFKPVRLGIIVKNVDSSSLWYQNTLGFKEYKRLQFPAYDSMKIAYLQKSGFEVELVQQQNTVSAEELKKNFDKAKTPLRGMVKLAFKVTKLSALYNEVRGKAKVLLPITNDKELNVDFFMIEDPDGNLLQFVQSKQN